MKYIKFSFTDKKLNISLPFDKAEAVMNSPETIVRITDRSGKWTGQTVNKSLLMATDVDWEATRQSNTEDEWKRREDQLLLEGGHTSDQLSKEEIAQRLADIKRDLQL